jgi:acyl-CoA oxidase
MELAKQGLSSYAFPQKYGGKEQKGSHISVYEMLGYTDLSLAIKFGVQFGLFGGAIHGLGTESHHKKYIEALMKAELLGCFAMTETGHGSNVKGLETTAHYEKDTDELIIHSPSKSAQKEYIGNGMHSSLAVVFAQLIIDEENKGVHAIVVPIRDDQSKLLPGIEIEDCGYKMGLNGVDNVRLHFDQVRVPRVNLLDKHGSIDTSGQYHSEITNPNKRFFTMLGALVVGRICVGLLGVNASKTALSIALKYAAKRKQFALKEGMEETLLLDYPSHQRRLLPLLAKTYASYFGLKALTKKFSESDGGDHRMIETLAAGLKSYATWNATQIIQECREACGGKGYLWENRLADLKADTDIFTTFEGDNTVLMQLVAKGLLTEFKQSFHDEGYRAVIRYLGDRLGARLKELNPITSRNWSQSHLLDFDFLLETFEYREKKLLITLSQRMQSYLKKRIAPHSAFLRCQNHMLVLAEAFIEHLILQEFHIVILNCKDDSLKNVLTKLFQLFGLHTIEKHKGWYLENNYMEGVKTKAIRRVIDKLLQEIRPESIALVDAFAIPDGVLGAKIIV